LRTAIEVLEKNGVNAEAIELDAEYSFANILRAMEEYATLKSLPAERIVMPKIAEMIDEVQAEHFGIMKKIELITTSDKRTTTWYESAAVIREMEELKRKLSNFSA